LNTDDQKQCPSLCLVVKPEVEVSYDAGLSIACPVADAAGYPVVGTGCEVRGNVRLSRIAA
jgi:hypothetical protein